MRERPSGQHSSCEESGPDAREQLRTPSMRVPRSLWAGQGHVPHCQRQVLHHIRQAPRHIAHTHRLVTYAGHRRTHSAHRQAEERDADPAGKKWEETSDIAQGQHGRNYSQDHAHRMTEVGVRKNGPDEYPDHEARDREQTVSCLRELRLSGLRACLCGVAAHERDIEAVLDECIRVDIPGDQSQQGSPPALLARGDLGRWHGSFSSSASEGLRGRGPCPEVWRTAH